MAKRKIQHNILQLKITLNGIKPPIWRRILVAADTDLEDLNGIILAAMGLVRRTHAHLQTPTHSPAIPPP